MINNPDWQHDSILIPPGMRAANDCLLCTRICRVLSVGILFSPVRLTEWTCHRMVADRFPDGGELRNEAGLHAVWRLPGVVPKDPYLAVLHCLASGRVRVGNLGLRAEVMEVQEIVLHHDAPDALLEAVRRHYPVCRVYKARKRKRMLMLDADGSYGMTMNGKLHGRWVWPDGKVGHYRGNLQHGCWTYPDGRVQHYRNGSRHGRWVWPDGSIGHYHNGWRHGRWTYPSGRVEKYNYNQRHGRWVWPDGSIGHYRNGKRHGKWIFPNGAVMYYADDQLVRKCHESITAKR